MKTRLTDKEKEFLADYGYLIQKWDISEMAEMFNTTRQNIQHHIDYKNKRGKYEKK